MKGKGTIHATTGRARTSPECLRAAAYTKPRRRTGAWLLSAVLSLSLVSCDPPQSTTPSASNDATGTAESEPEKDADTQAEKTPNKDQSAADSKISTKDRPKPIEPALKPGQYCYQSNDATQDIAARITVESNDRITGKMQGTIHNEAEGYFTSYDKNLNGTIDGSNLNLDVATWIEFDKQNAQETWRVSPNELRMGKDKLTGTSCEQVNKVFQNEDGLEAEDLLKSANNVKTQQVYFDAGKSGTTLSGAVVRGDRDVYLLTAQGGQILYPTLTSTEDNAVFDIVDPSGRILATEVTNPEQIYLPYTGDYQLIVGGTRGNATYDFAIAIE